MQKTINPVVDCVICWTVSFSLGTLLISSMLCPKSWAYDIEDHVEICIASVFKKYVMHTKNCLKGPYFGLVKEVIKIRTNLLNPTALSNVYLI